MKNKSLAIGISFVCIIVLLVLSSESVYAVVKTCTVAGCKTECKKGSNYCKVHTCQKEGCYGLRNGNGTVYCDEHAKQYADSEGYIPCAAHGCYGRRATKCSYCYQHKCDKSGCTCQAIENSEYCNIHQPKPIKKVTKTYQKPTQRKNTTKNYDYDPYDANEYDNPDDFADEWAEEFGDGDFDDGYDDACDYWEEEHEDG